MHCAIHTKSSEISFLAYVYQYFNVWLTFVLYISMKLPSRSGWNLVSSLTLSHLTRVTKIAVFFQRSEKIHSTVPLEYTTFTNLPTSNGKSLKLHVNSCYYYFIYMCDLMETLYHSTMWKKDKGNYFLQSVASLSNEV